MLGRKFVPHPGPQRQKSHPTGWETSLVGWSGLTWTAQTLRWSALENPTRNALVKVARRTTRKTGSLTLGIHPGEVQTSRPLGTRMGKGKGRPAGCRRWTPRGERWLFFRGSRPTGWGVLPGRTPGGLKVDRLFW